MRFFIHNREKIREDAWVLETFACFTIDFCETPVQVKQPNKLALDTEKMDLIDTEVTHMLEKGALVRVTGADETKVF